MASADPLYRYDTGYYEYIPGLILPGKMVPEGHYTCTKEAVDAAINVDIDDSDVLFATYPKTGETIT